MQTVHHMCLISMPCMFLILQLLRILSSGIPLILSAHFNIASTLTRQQKYSGQSMFGVFVISDVDGNIQYVSTTNLSMDEELRQCLERQGASRVHKIRAQSFSVANTIAADAYREELLHQLGGPPPGNIEEENNNSSESQHTEEEKQRIGDPHLPTSLASSALPSTNSLRASISRERSAFVESRKGYIQSPFDYGNDIVNNSRQTLPSMLTVTGPLDLSVENVDKVLEQVRPYLIADGGNVAVVGVDEISRNIILRLQGACGSCPSSTTTMKMGIEKVLKENFIHLGEVIAAPPETLSIAMVEEKIKYLLPAVKDLGGVVDIMSVDEAKGKVYISYKGPPKLMQGLTVIIKELDSVVDVVIEDTIL